MGRGVRHGRWLGLVALAAVLTASTSSAAAPGWTIVSSPNKGPSWVFGLSALAPDDAWAVGNYYEHGYEPLAEHWDGASWTIIDTPDLPSDTVLSDVADASASEAWAVGTTNLGNHPTKTLILHWDGTAWEARSSPSPSKDPFYGENPLYGVAALPSGEAWAVGYRFTNGGYQALILHWNGSVWDVADVPKIAYRKLTSVVALGPNDVWAVGYDFTLSDGYQPAALHWDGRRWRSVPPVQVGTGSGFLNGLTVTPSGDLWAVGYRMEDGVPQPLFERWDGGSWSMVESPHLNSGYNFLNGIQAVSDDNVWAAGYRQLGGGDVTFLEHWNGVRWQVVSTPNVPGGGNLLWDIAVDGDGGLWAGGYVYPEDFSPIETLMLRLEGP
jgi:hypothetical protein